jgi:hypothetical protein
MTQRPRWHEVFRSDPDPPRQLTVDELARIHHNISPDSSTVDAESTTTPESSMNHKTLTLAVTLALLAAPAALPATATAPGNHAAPATQDARSSWSHHRHHA